MSHLKIVQGGSSGRPNEQTAVDTLNEFNRQDALENSHSEGTRYKYENMARNFARFLGSRGAVWLPVSEINIPLLRSFAQWLPENLSSCNRTHISKHIYRINKSLDFAVTQGYLQANPCAAYKVKRDRNKGIVHLDDKEFQIWIFAEWSQPIYQKSQELYTFQMTTGLSYMDLFSYRTMQDPRTGLWIEGTRGKTKKPYYIPLFHSEFKHARRIHEKYNGRLPYIENHSYNRYIREMAAQLGIEKYLKSHIGRKTFSVLMGDAGISIPGRAAMLGNSERVCEQYYDRPSRNRVLAAFRHRQA